MTKLDLHIHTEYSSDAITTIREVLKISRARDLNFIAITDHNTTKGAFNALKLSDDVTVIPGVEISTKYGHIIALNITEKFEVNLKIDIYEIIDNIHKDGGLVIIAHPFDILSPFKGIKHAINYVDGIELANASTLNYSSQIKRGKQLLSSYQHLGFTAGSDSHIPDTIGDTILYHPDQLATIDDVISYIIRRKFTVMGKRTSLKNRIKKLIYTLL